ncbi:MAG: hypothetical protein MI799_09895 [Desulfobacterales bacterium]|nr:hypothetical protein [Desulfobacterales bacterium]
MNKNINKKLTKRKKKSVKSLKKNWMDQAAPKLIAPNIHYVMDDRIQNISCGDIGLIHMPAKKTGLLRECFKGIILSIRQRMVGGLKYDMAP